MPNWGDFDKKKVTGEKNQLTGPIRMSLFILNITINKKSIKIIQHLYQT